MHPSSPPSASRPTPFRPWSCRWLLGGALVVLGLVMAGCGGSSTPLRWRYTDLVTDGAWTSSRGEVTPAAHGHCADETYFAQRLAAGESLTATVTVGSEGTLSLAGCLGGGPIDADAVTVQVVVAGGRRPIETSVPMPASPSWWQQTVALDDAAGATVEVTIERTGGGPRQLWLRDAFVKHRLAVAPQPATADTGTDPDTAAGPPRILLISVDTLRGDAIGALGGPWSTPNLDALVASAETFTHSWSAASWTKPSHGSLLTGRSPQAHGALSQTTGLHPALETVATRLGRHGVRTAGLVQDIVHLDPRFGFDRGFDAYRTEHWTLPQMARHTADWIARHRDQSFFFFFHTFAVHSDFERLPYEADGIRRAAVDAKFTVDGYGCTGSWCASGRLAKINEGEITPLANEAEILRYLYGAGVEQADRELGVFFDDLRALGVWDDLLIILTSDHGEAFLEHGEVLHGSHWEPIMRVPMIVKWPGGRNAGVRTPHNVTGLDVTPTLLAAAGAPNDDLPGTDLARLRRGDRPLMLGTYARTLIEGQHKLTVLRQGGPMRLFDLAADPAEQHDLIDSQPELKNRLLVNLRARHQAAHRTREELDRLGVTVREQPLSDEERQRLEALGYLDG